MKTLVAQEKSLGTNILIVYPLGTMSIAMFHDSLKQRQSSSVVSHECAAVRNKSTERREQNTTVVLIIRRVSG